MKLLTGVYLLPYLLFMAEIKKFNLPELKKASGCIHVNHTLSGPAMRLYNCLLAYIQDIVGDSDGMPYFAVPREMIREYFNTRNDETIKGWLKELAKAEVEFNNLGKGSVSWGFYTFIQEPEYRGEYVTFSIARTLRELIADAKIFALIDMMVERKFKKTRYSIPLYELGLDYRDNKDKVTGKNVTPWIKIHDFRSYMGIKSGEYPEFKTLNQAVIKPAWKEINTESDIIMTPEFKREKRKVNEVRFLIEDNKVNMSLKKRIQRIQRTLPIEGSLGIQLAHFAEKMTALFGIAKGRAKKAAKLYAGRPDDFERITSIIEAKYRAGECKSKTPGGWAVTIYEEEGHKLMTGKALDD